MKSVTYFTFCFVFYVSTIALAVEQPENAGKVTGGDTKKAHAIIDKKCTACHTKERIDAALSSGRDMNAIQKDMEKRGVKLNSNEREVLGIFWKQSKPITKK